MRVTPSSLDVMVLLDWTSIDRTKTHRTSCWLDRKLLGASASRQDIDICAAFTTTPTDHFSFPSRHLQATSFTRRSCQTIHTLALDTINVSNAFPITVLDELGHHWPCSHHRSRKAAEKQPMPLQKYFVPLQRISLLLLHVCLDGWIR